MPTGPKNDTRSQPRRRWRVLVAMACAYTLWLGWLTYVASVNVQFGNQ
jgi:hypothetical protein